MGAIKDATDLILVLEKRITDRKILDMLLPIKQAIIQAEKENLDLERLNFRLERDHNEKVENIKSLHAKEMENLKSQHNKEIEKIIRERDSLKLEIEKNSSKKGMASIKIIRS
ncbi:MAG: hypothetical protein HGB12_13020 [Bacteroidetes bacterium]|nr:hypothetical protein [Bacteroidota bacterium]